MTAIFETRKLFEDFLLIETITVSRMAVYGRLSLPCPISRRVVENAHELGSGLDLQIIMIFFHEKPYHLKDTIKRR